MTCAPLHQGRTSASLQEHEIPISHVTASCLRTDRPARREYLTDMLQARLRRPLSASILTARHSRYASSRARALVYSDRGEPVDV